MGNQSSVIDPVHLRMYNNLIQMKDPMKRVQIIQMCLSSMEYIQSAKRAGIYSHLLHYLTVAQSGQTPTPLPGERDLSSASASAAATPSPIPRSVQSHPSSMTTTLPSHGIGAVHPSLLNAPTASTYQQQAIQTYSSSTPSWKVVTETPKQKALGYFSSCLEVLGIQEEVALTEESLKKAYKKMALKAHPDKGGSEEFFEAVTRAYAYLSEILRHMNGNRRATTNGSNTSVQSTQQQREQEAKQWEHTEPVRLNAKNLDMNAFNRMFEQTHLPDPDSDGYGDWLKDADGQQASSQKFKGQFNRDVFNRMFEDEAKKSQRSNNQLVVHPGEMALMMNPTSGVDLVSERPSSFTAAPNSRFQYTDLRGAYTSDSTISDKVSNITVKERKLDEYRASRERAPDPLTDSELHGIRDFERRQKEQDTLRERKRAEMAVRNQHYFDRMKQLVITDGATNLNQGMR
jgi:curved DNA-binding protein CbpA